MSKLGTSTDPSTGGHSTFEGDGSSHSSSHYAEQEIIGHHALGSETHGKCVSCCYVGKVPRAREFPIYKGNARSIVTEKSRGINSQGIGTEWAFKQGRMSARTPRRY